MLPREQVQDVVEHVNKGLRSRVCLSEVHYFSMSKVHLLRHGSVLAMYHGIVLLWRDWWQQVCSETIRRRVEPDYKVPSDAAVAVNKPVNTTIMLR